MSMTNKEKVEMAMHMLKIDKEVREKAIKEKQNSTNLKMELNSTKTQTTEKKYPDDIVEDTLLAGLEKLLQEKRQKESKKQNK